ncbi:MAG TPA: hypothetical protein VES20_13955 [Bryobacteraceae bacterium]|nr:hypothetical protein [Bryobacteraceae bacterium]
MPVDLAKDLIVRWDNPDPGHVPLLRQAGITAVLLSSAHPEFATACATADIAVVPASDLQFVNAPGLGQASGTNVVLTNGLWPGIRRPPNVAGQGDETASASREPWVDANGFWIAWMRAIHPNRPAVLGYLPDLGDRGVPFDTLELALVEARVMGGNYILSVEPAYRAALLRNDPKAGSAWKQLGQTARWLRDSAALFGRPCPPTITALVDSGASSAEIVNLLYRRNGSPLVAATLRSSARQGCLAIVAAGLRQPGPDVIQQLISEAQAGAVVITDQPWLRVAGPKPLRGDPDREFFEVGKGQVLAYRRRISDPSEFALDVIDVVTHKRRPVRLWNAPAIVAVVTESAERGERLVQLVNYGSPVTSEVQLRVQGQYARATLRRPDGSPLSLKAASRGSTTEVFVPELRRTGVLIFS